MTSALKSTPKAPRAEAPRAQAKDGDRWHLIQEKEEEAKVPAKNEQKSTPMVSRLPLCRTNHEKVQLLAGAHARALAAGDADLVSVVKGMARSAFGNRPVRTKLVQAIATATVAANTAMAVSIPADMALTGNFASFVNLFDEVRCHEVRSQALVGMGSNNTTVALGINILFAMQYDPIDATAPGSILATLTASRHTEAYTQYANTGFSFATGNFVTSIPATKKDSWLHLSSGKLVVDQLPPNSGGVISPSPVGGNWCATVSGALVVGWFKLYGEDPQTNDLSWMYRLYNTFDVEFRFRG